MHLFDAQVATQDLRECRDWEKVNTSWDAFGVAWDQHNESLARVLGTSKFLLVSAAFSAIASLARSRVKDGEAPPPGPSGPPNFSPTDERLVKYLDRIAEAQRIVLGASFTWSERSEREATLVSAGSVVDAVDDTVSD